MQIVCNKVLLTEFISPLGDDATSSDVDWDLREGEVSCYDLRTSNHLSREPRDEGTLKDDALKS